jgi:hypothetical protein
MLKGSLMILSNKSCKQVIGILGLSLLGACAQEVLTPPATNNVPPSSGRRSDSNPVEESEMLVSGRVALDWGIPEFITSGYMFSGLLTFNEADTGEGFFCFENNSAPCRRANAGVRGVVQNNPVAIQSFQLNMTTGINNVFSIQSAAVTTAEIQFNSIDGRVAFVNRHTRQYVPGRTCDLNAPNTYTIGFGSYHTSAATVQMGTEKVLTGLYLYDEPGTNQERTRLDQAYLTAGRVDYSGLRPVASNSASEPFAFEFVPRNEAAQAFFGKEEFVTQDTQTVIVSPKFGLDPDYAANLNPPIPRASSHVIIGFCLQTSKAIAPNVNRPGFWGGKFRLYRPRLFLRETN